MISAHRRSGDRAASLASLREDTAGRKWRAGVYLMVGIAAVVASPSWVSLRLSEYKGLSQALLDLPPEKWTPGYAYFASACCGVM